VVPTFDKLMLPLLRYTADGEAHTVREVIAVLADHLQLTDRERDEMLPSGSKRRFDDRVQWAKTYLTKANLLERTGRGTFKITERGLRVLEHDPAYIDTEFLKQFPEFEAFLLETRLKRNRDYELLSLQTPRVLMHTAYENMQIDLTEELLDCVLTASPAFFERLVIDLLLAMGYGGTHKATAKTLGRSGDGGIDGVIQEDKLGLDKIYVQAKRWARDNAVGRPVVQAFIGSLMGVGANRGVLMTTSRFSEEAIDYTRSVRDMKVILIDGKRLAELMIEHDVGVNVEKAYVIKRIDTDYFDVG